MKANNAPSKLSILTNGIIKENPRSGPGAGHLPHSGHHHLGVHRIGMGLAAAIVLICSNILISLLRKMHPRFRPHPLLHRGHRRLRVRGADAGAGLLPGSVQRLGVYLPLIVVNCIISGRAEMFASKNSGWIPLWTA